MYAEGAVEATGEVEEANGVADDVVDSFAMFAIEPDPERCALRLLDLFTEGAGQKGLLIGAVAVVDGGDRPIGGDATSSVRASGER